MSLSKLSEVYNPVAPSATWKGEGSNQQPIHLMYGTPDVSLGIASHLNPNEEEAWKINSGIDAHNVAAEDWSKQEVAKDHKSKNYAASGGLFGGLAGYGVGDYLKSTKFKGNRIPVGILGAVGGGLAGMAGGKALVDPLNPGMKENLEQAKEEVRQSRSSLNNTIGDIMEERGITFDEFAKEHQEKQAGLAKIAVENYPKKSREEALKGVSVKEDKDGVYVMTHRSRSKSYPSLDKIPTEKIRFVESTG